MTCLEQFYHPQAFDTRDKEKSVAVEKSAQEDTMEDKDTSMDNGQEEATAKVEVDVTEAEDVDVDDSEIINEEPDLEEELAKAREEIQGFQDKFMRQAADYENAKKRMARERDAALKYAEENILKEILPTVDNLERALDTENQQHEIGVLMEGVELTLKGLLSTLEKFGIQQLECVGHPFDPNFHEAMIMESSTEVLDQHVIREFEKGYQYKDRLLRAAKVVVSKGDV